ncbi:MAG: phosphate signaling complex protein PhoU [Calditrichia bacterium]
MLKEELNKIKQQFLEESYLVNQMLEKSIKGLLERNEGLLKEVIEKDEETVNNLEVEIDKDCIKIIALYGPAAKDLRQIMMIFKISDDLERMADHTVNICDSGLFLIKRPPIKPLVDIPRMAEITKKMLQDTIHAFVEHDHELALEICKRDDEVDSLRDQIIRELITYMAQDAKTIEPAMHLMRISKNIERIADLITNIAEDIVYIETGKLIKHKYN